MLGFEEGHHFDLTNKPAGKRSAAGLPTESTGGNMGFDNYGIEVDGDCIWLLDAGGQRLCDLTEMQLLDFGRRISVEGGLLNFDLDAAEWRERLIALGLEPH
jgi:hypothetical protein